MQQSYQINHLSDLQDGMIEYEFSQVPTRGIYLFTASIPLSSSLRRRTVQIQLVTKDSNQNVLEVDDQCVQLTVWKRTISKQLIIHKNKAIVCVQLKIIGNAVRSDDELVVDVTLSQKQYIPQNTTSIQRSLSFSNDSNVAHFIVLSHGNNGTKDDLLYKSELLTLLFNQYAPHQDFYVLCARSNSSDTWNGVDVGGKRLASEIEEYYNIYLKDYSKVYFSIAGHSLGGLYIRYAISILQNHPDFNTKLIPTTFMTISSPHLGARKPPHSFVKSTMSYGTNIYLKILGATGQQLAVSDTGHNGNNDPLLVQMSLPDSPFIQALNQFKHKTLVASTYYDMAVPHCTAAVMHAHDFPVPNSQTCLSFQLVGHSGFDSDNMVYNEILDTNRKLLFQSEDIDTTQTYLPDKALETEYSTMCMKNLQLVQWRRLHLQFEAQTYGQMLYVHDCVINKKSIISTMFQKDDKGPIQCVELLCHVLLSDHLN
jgi:hypothetical protein